MFIDLLRKHIRQGVIQLHLPNGQVQTIGDNGPQAQWVITDARVLSRIATDWEFELGETYMRGGWHSGDSDLGDLLSILRLNFPEYSQNRWIMPFSRLMQQWNRISRSYRNVAQHYDLAEDFFRLFLDREMHYSCAYFKSEDISLEQAQQDKCRHIAAKLLCSPGQQVLDVGCGWGSMAFYLFRHCHVDVTGLTLSQEQLKVAERRARSLGIESTQFLLQDYREHEGLYDRIYSIGMFEHVGRPNYQTYFEKVRTLLKDDGVALIHTIGRSGPPGITNPWIRKYIFPGGSIPALSEMLSGVEQVRLMLTDVEVLRLHYARTLHEWHLRLQAHQDEIIHSMGDSFYRMWEFYLKVCETAFQYSDLVVFQLQLAKQHHVVPTTRDYIYRGEIGSKLARKLKLVG